ncbi:MAG: DUF6519 domain-containing protein [Methylococcaceae bacterium]|nr:DUF6519 domain-containing protein [Methylococcaceae bacterium]
MSGDKAKISYDENQHYRSVVMQQGRVTLEADWNEQGQIISEEIRKEALDFVGPSGAPDEGYAVSKGGDGGVYDLSLSPGTLYVGGMRVSLDAKPSTDYGDQADWLDSKGDPDWVPVPESLPNTNEYVYLLLREQEISAVEDSALLEVALGGPDTATRTRLIQRIVRHSTKQQDCPSALDELLKGRWKDQGLAFDYDTLRLESKASLAVDFVDSAASSDPCQPQSTGGYLGAENQLIRVKIVDSATLVWGYDNASFLYRVKEVDNNKELELNTRPVDSSRQPKQDQAVEILRAAAKLSNGEYVAAADGFVTTLSADYKPDSQLVELTLSLPPEYPQDPVSYLASNPIFLRVWQETVSFTAGTPVPLKGTGLTVTLTPDANGHFHAGDFWLFAVRPGSPTEVYPQRYKHKAPQFPDGPRLWACPLALVDWDAKPGVLDCRNPFDNLVELTRRKPGSCCEIQVSKVLAKNGYDQEVTLQNGMELQADNLAKGLRLILDKNIDPDTVHEAACFVTFQLPYPLIPLNPVDQGIWGHSIIGYQPLVLPAEVEANPTNIVTWRPFDDPSLFFQGEDRLQAMRRRRAASQFQKDWRIFDPPSRQGQTFFLPSQWAYQEDSVAQKSLAGHTLGGEGFQGLNTHCTNNQSLNEDAYYIGLTVNTDFTHPSGSVSKYQDVGLIFNWRSDEDYYLFLFSWHSIDLKNATGQSNQEYSSVVVIYHVLKGETIFITESSDGLSHGSGISNIDNLVTPDVVSLNIKLTRNGLLFRAKAKYLNLKEHFDTSFFAQADGMPQTLLAGSRIGLSTRFVTARFTRLEVIYPGARTVHIPAGGSRLLANLTLKRNFIQPISTANQAAGNLSLPSTPSSCQTDFERWFWVMPPIPSYYYHYYSIYDFLGFGSELL